MAVAEPGPEGPSTFEFGPFRLDIYARRLTRDGRPLVVSPRGFDLLVVLVRNGGRTVTKAELLDRVWPGIFVDEVNLAQHVSILRRVLGDDLRTPRYIATVPRQGYHFVAPVRVAPPETAGQRGRTGGSWRTRVSVGAGLLIALVTIALSWNGASPPDRGSSDPEALDAFARGRHFIAQGSHDSSTLARDAFLEAIRRDPTFAEAHAELAIAYVSLFLGRSLELAEARALAQGAATEALRLDDGLATAHLAQGAVSLQLGGGFEAAEPELRRAIAIDPASDLAYDLLARGLRHYGRFDESIDAARRALALDATSVRYHILLATSLHFSGTGFDEARRLYRRALELDPSSTSALIGAAELEETDGRLAEAVRFLVQLEKRRDRFDAAQALERDALRLGEPEALRRYRTSQLDLLDPNDPATGFERGRLLIRLGRIDDAFASFERASEGGFSIGLFALQRHPAYRVLTEDPRFARLTSTAIPR